MYKLLLHKKAAKYYANLDEKASGRINRAIEILLENPTQGPHIRRLRGRCLGKYRYAVGALRIVYQVDQEHEKILIEAIGPRGDIYK